jgi:exopolyphosphatase/guanosine-5'-triphosphate,3'-diphosphate pyrophosphatase
MQTLKLAAIDIGSNAARLLITDVVETANHAPQFNKIDLIRVPLRLGFDVFETGLISEKRTVMIIETMKAFRHLLKVYEVNHLKVCATSAMRDATNSPEIIEKVKTETGIEIEILTGDLEAAVIYETHVAESMDSNNSYLYIDVGGGSTELNFFGDSKLIFKQSFNIGTIRLLKNLVDEKLWNEMREVIKTKTKGYKKIVAIGSGGNINKIFSMSKKKDGKPLELGLLRDYFKEFSALSVKERMRLYDLKEDRADVIVPALQIYINVMRWADADEILVPKIGLADGLVQHLYSELRK